MKTLVNRSTLITLAVMLRVVTAAAQDGNFLNIAILNLPDRYFADVPQKNRMALLLHLSQTSSDHRLDYAHGWLHDYGDNLYEGQGETSMLYVKLLPRKDRTPLVFVHMPKPYADGSEPRNNQTFVLEQDGRQWRDVTSRVIPAQVNLAMYFQPRRSIDVIEVAAYERFKRDDGRGYAYRLADRKFDLQWDGASFHVIKAKKPELSDDDL